MLDSSGMLIGAPVPADPVFIKNEATGKVLAFPSVAVQLMSDQIFQNIISMVRMAVRNDQLDLMLSLGQITEEQAAALRMRVAPAGGPLPEHPSQSSDGPQAGG